MLVIIMMVGEDLRGSAYQYGFHDAVELLGVIGLSLIVGGPIAYGIMIAIGLPFYFIARKLGLLNLWSITFGAAVVAIFPLLLMSASNGFVLYKEPEKSSFLLYLAVALCGYVVGLVFWYVSGLHKQRPEKTG